jgi:prevent-host-death family protein
VKTVNMHEAKTHLSKLVAEAVAGEPFLIAKAGKPLVKVEVIEDKPEEKPSRLGFLEGQWKVPEDFDTFMQDEILEMFYGEGNGQKFAGLDFPYPEPGDPDQRLRHPAGWQKGEK